MIVVSDAGALIDLCDSGCIEVLHELFEEVFIPEEVFGEVFKRGRAKPKWIKIKSTEDVAALAAFAKMRLAVDDGEAAAIALAMELRTAVIIEDKAGMIQCERHRVGYLSLFKLLNDRLPPKRCAAIIEAIRSKTGKLLCEPEI